MSNDALYLKYRPKTFAEIVGQPTLVASMQTVIEKRSAHSFLMVGPSGCGKTTIARIAAAELGCAEVIEVDAATNNGIDDMREVTNALRYKPMKGGAKALIIDEVHAASKQAFQSLLKSVEEPPDWAYWFLCTTDQDKVPKTIVTRCARFEVRTLDWETLSRDLLIPVADAEQMSCTDEVINVCARNAGGSPRQALVNLAMCANEVDTKAAAKLLLSMPDDDKAGIDLARVLVAGTTWKEVQPLLDKLRDENAEGVRHVVRAYVTTVLLSGKNPAKAPQLFAILQHFSVPFYSADGISPLVLAVGNLVF